MILERARSLGPLPLPSLPLPSKPLSATPLSVTPLPSPLKQERRRLLRVGVVALAAPFQALASGGVDRPVTSPPPSPTTAPGTSAPGSVRRPTRQHTPLPMARDLAPRPGVRYLVLFSVTNCPWCEVVRAKHLRHRLDSRRADQRIDVSEVMIDRDDRLVGPDGRPTTGRELSRRLGVKVGPTVMAFDGAGQPAGEPVVGAMIEDFYEAYLDKLLDQAVR